MINKLGRSKKLHW